MIDMKEKSLPRKSTTIAITKSTRNAVAAIGSKDQSFEEIIQLLLEKWNENNE